MTTQRIVLLIAAIATPLFAQMDTNGLTVTATRQRLVQPDQQILEVLVDSTLNASLDDVVAAIASAGIKATDLSGVSGPSTQGSTNTPVLEWAFRFTVPLATLRNTLAALDSLVQTIGGKNTGWSLRYFGSGVQVSQQALAAQQCSIPALIADARAQAQKTASATGVSLGPIIAVSDGKSLSSGTVEGILVLGGFVTPTAVGVTSFLLPQSPPQTCSVVVKFSLLPNQ